MFIQRLYKLRHNEENKKMKKIYINLMNSLYGKYASIYEIIKIINHNQHNYQEAIIKKYENIAVAASITSLARCFMYEYIISNQLDLYYWDTDGIIISNLFIKNVGNDLGQFRLVDKIEKGVCISPKLYLYKANNTYRYILRSIPQNLYEINGEQLYQLFLKELEKFPNYKFEFTINIPLMMKNTDTEKILTFTFINKRRYQKEQDKIGTNPWIIKAI